MVRYDGAGRVDANTEDDGDLDAIVSRFKTARSLAQEKAVSLLTTKLKDAAKEISAKYPGCRVVAFSAMGSWGAVVSNATYVYDDGSVGKRDIHVGSKDGDDDHHEVFADIDMVWEELQTYPILRVTISEDGAMTSESEW